MGGFEGADLRIVTESTPLLSLAVWHESWPKYPFPSSDSSNNGRTLYGRRLIESKRQLPSSTTTPTRFSSLNSCVVSCYWRSPPPAKRCQNYAASVLWLPGIQSEKDCLEQNSPKICLHLFWCASSIFAIIKTGFVISSWGGFFCGRRGLHTYNLLAIRDLGIFFFWIPFCLAGFQSLMDGLSAVSSPLYTRVNQSGSCHIWPWRYVVD